MKDVTVLVYWGLMIVLGAGAGMALTVSDPLVRGFFATFLITAAVYATYQFHGFMKEWSK